MTPMNGYPFEFGHGGGSFIATASSPLYTGMPLGALTKSYHWHSKDYVWIITAIGLQTNITKSTTPGWVNINFNKTKNITVRNTGGTIVSRYAEPKRTSMMSNDELVTYLEVRNANTGGTGLTKGTRVVGSEVARVSFYSKDVGIGSNQFLNVLDFAQAEPLFIEDNEGIEVSFETAMPAGLEINLVSTLRFVVLPTEVVKNYF